MNDLNESKAIKNLFGDHAYKLVVDSTKSMTGHLLGAAGGIEAIGTVLAIENSLIPPTINLTHPDPECDLNYSPHKPTKKEIKYAISNTFGFGGQFDVSPMMGFRLGWDRYQLDDTVNGQAIKGDVDFISVGALFRF